MRTLNPILLLLGWAISRFYLVQQTFGRHRWIFGDVHYYFEEIAKERIGDIALKEYPEANLWLIRLIDRLAPDSVSSFEHYYVGFILALDLLFFALFFFRKHYLASWFWVAFGFVVGPIYLTRLDLIPGLLVGLFAYSLASRPNLAAAFLAAATMMKLWPGVLASVLVGHYRSLKSWLRLAVFGGTIVAMALATIMTQGFDRLLSPLGYQTTRGLQIESIAATPFVLLASTGSGSYQVSYASSKSFEITGPGVAVATQLASLALYAVVFFAVVIVVRALFRPEWRPQEAIPLALVLIMAVLVTNKVFSPQYVVWLAPIVAVSLCFTTTRPARRAAVLILVITWLTYLVYPVYYVALTTDHPELGPALLLSLRNILMLTLLALCVQWWRREAHLRQQS